MNRKEILSDLYQKALHSLKTLSDWNDFWRFQGKLYKYDFTNALLLWQQNREVTQVADLLVWSRFGRRVPKGTKSLFTWDVETEKMGYVFDIQSTYATKDISVRPWDAGGEEEKIRQGLLEKYPRMEKDLSSSAASISLEKALRYAIFQSIKERDMALLKEIKEQLKIGEREALEEALNYISYMTYAVRAAVSARLNIDLSLSEDNGVGRYFDRVKEKGFLELTGNYISDAVEDVLREAEGSVKEYDRQRKQRSEENRHRKWNRIYRERRWASLSEYRSRGRRGESGYRNRQSVAEVYERELSGTGSAVANSGRTGREDALGREGSLGDGIYRGESVSGESSGDSGELSRFSHKDAGGQGLRHGENGKGVSLPVSLEITEAEIEQVLVRQGTGFYNGKYRIYDFFRANPEAKKRVEFLKKEYGIGGWSSGSLNGISGADWNAKGIEIKKTDTKRFLNWPQTALIIEKMITEDRFFTEEEKEGFRSYREEKITKQIEREKAYWNYKEVHKLFLFGKEYEIQETRAEVVMLREAAFPLNTLELTKEEMEKEAILYAQNDESWITEEEKLLQEGEGEAWVRVLWSEGNIPEQSLFSFSVADALFARLDGERVAEKQREDFDGFPYDKTKFEITVRLDDGEIVTYSGRQDFGDGDGSLYEHIERELSRAGLTGETKEKTAQFLQVLNAARGSAKERQDEKAATETFRIYQLKQTGETAGLSFMPYSYLRARGIELSFGSYDEVYAGELVDEESLENIYEKFNTEPPEDFTGRSLSISDIVVLEKKGGAAAYYVDSMGYREVPEFLKQREKQQQKESEKEKRLQAPALAESADKETAEKPLPAVDAVMPEEEKALSPSERLKRNIKAIETLLTLEREERSATPEERKRLSGYVGWGGLADTFDEEKGGQWQEARNFLKENLTEEEYSAARSSVLNAHYTPGFVVEEIHQYLSRCKVSGKILEPAAGIGNFLRSRPNIHYSAVEIDSLSGRILKQRFPAEDIQIKGLEETDFADDSFDAVIGNVPFGNYKVFDERYKRQNFLIHDYFLAKSLDKVKPGGVLALITGKGTLDKETNSVRRYLSERAELLGAVRLPAGAFATSAGTDVTADILILQKRQQQGERKEGEASWLSLAMTEGGVPVNEYFIHHPEHLLGEMRYDERFFGKGSKYTGCFLREGSDLKTELKLALESIPAATEILAIEVKKEREEKLPAVDEIENHTYAVRNEKIYYRSGEEIRLVKLTEKKVQRLTGMIGLSSHVTEMLRQQRENCSDEVLEGLQKELKEKYDAFVKKYGEITEKANRSLFENDRYSPFLFSLEQQDKDGNRIYSDLFYQRILKSPAPVTQAEDAKDALLVSLNERGRIDLSFMKKLMGQRPEMEIIKELKGQIYYNPVSQEYETAEEYLSGNVREKLKAVKDLLREELPPEFEKDLQANETALTSVLPEDLSAAEIEVRLGTTWIEAADYEKFMYELFKTPFFLQGERGIGVEYNAFAGSYYIRGKSLNNGNLLVKETYGTGRKNAYQILEETLNLKEIRIYDSEWEDGKEKKIFNAKETILVKEKQKRIKDAFKGWIWKDQSRREKYERYYNDTFNNLRLREYNGDFLTFPGQNPNIFLQPHQRQAIARCLMSGKNTLLAHAVGAGKTYEMIAACMEGKRLGLWEKPLFVVPNHLTGQTGTAFLTLYPGASILVATEKDFLKEHRELFFAKMATGNYDAIIIGQTQLIRIGLSKERQIKSIQKEIKAVSEAIAEQKKEKQESWTTKNMEALKKKMEGKLSTLLLKTEKTNLLTFEELKIDQLFIDEAHDFKSLSIATKMNRVAGLSGTESQRAFDLLTKVDYLREKYQAEEGKERGTIFATATPLSNSMVELYVMQKYLQQAELEKRKLYHFDDWATNFGETITSLELAPEGTGFKLRTRFAKFVNLPDLLSIFKEIADIKTDKMLNLEKPEAEYITVEAMPSAFAKEKMAEFALRAEKIRGGNVPPREDNMLKITYEGRYLGTDPRLLYAAEFEKWEEATKLDYAAERIFQVYQDTKEERSVQIVFSDIGVPDKNRPFTVYEYVKEELIKKGVSQEEICFIHDAETAAEKESLFNELKAGKKRIIFGSTSKMGTGTNIQNKAIALHHIDCPWKSSDIEQREGRILRPGNENKKVQIYRYITKGTFDAYLWQIVEQKQRFIDQVMNNRLVNRTAEDIDEKSLSYAEVKALATGDPMIGERIELEIDIARLSMLKVEFEKRKYQKENVLAAIPGQIAIAEEAFIKSQMDYELRQKEVGQDFSIVLHGQEIKERSLAAEKLKESYLIFLKEELFRSGLQEKEIGSYRGFSLSLQASSQLQPELIIRGQTTRKVESESYLGLILRLENKMEPEALLAEAEKAKRRAEELKENQKELENMKKEAFPHEAALREKEERLKEIDLCLQPQAAEEVADDEMGKDEPQLAEEVEMEREL